MIRLRHRLVTDNAGTWILVWDSEDLGVRQVLYARSFDAGATWTDPLPLSASLPGESAEPNIDTDGAGNWGVVWRCDDRVDIWGTPGEARLVLLAKNETGDAVIGWSPPLIAGGTLGSLVYDVIRTGQPLTCTVTEDQKCIDDDSTDTNATDAEVPPSGETFFYQARAENACPAVGPLTVDGEKPLRRAILCP